MTGHIFQTQTMTALDTWLLLAKIILFLELLEYAIVLHIRFSNATLGLDYCSKKCKRTKPEVLRENTKSDKEMDDLMTAKCKKIDFWALLIFLLETTFTNIVYFAYYIQ